MVSRVGLVWVLVAAVCAGQARGDMTIDSYTAETNDRFTNSPLFIGSSFDWSGVGRNAQGKWATLISPNTIVSAFHATPSGEISFFPNNDPNSTPVVRTVIQSQQVGATDVWIAQLSSNVPSSIKHYGFATEALSGPGPNPDGTINIVNAGSLQGQNAFMVGFSPAVHPSNQDQAVGRNLITGYSENVPFNNPDNDSLILSYNMVGDVDYTTHESLVQGGDSGGPLFVEQNGDLLLLGVNSFQAQNDSGVPIASGISYVGNVSGEMQQFINATAVPEPSSAVGVLMVAGGLFFFFLRRKRAGRSSNAPVT